MIPLSMVQFVLFSGMAWVGRAQISERTYAEQTRQVVQDVLSRREFAHLREDSGSFWEPIWRWLAKLFRPVIDALNSAPPWLFWFLMIWMILTLLAILAHLVYVVCSSVGSGGKFARGRSAGAARGTLLGVVDLDFESVDARARELLAHRNWADAMRYLYVAAILWLDYRHLISFHISKTNRDYLAELPAESSGRSLFQAMTTCFEGIAYGGDVPTEAECLEMSRSLEALQRVKVSTEQI